MSLNSIGLEKSKKFAVRIVRMYSFLCNHGEYVMSKQILRSGTSIGANLTEGVYAQSRADFFSKVSIALKEAAETEYWLELLYETDHISQQQFNSMSSECIEIIRILTSTIKTLKSTERYE